MVYTVHHVKIFSVCETHNIIFAFLGKTVMFQNGYCMVISSPTNSPPREVTLSPNIDKVKYSSPGEFYLAV